MNRFSKARKFASRIVEKENLVPPVDIIKLLNDRNIQIEKMENQYGIEAYSILNGNPKVFINTEIAYEPRKLFTLAHELGHICIPWHNGDTKCNTDTPFWEYENKRLLDTQELEANIFASELLMPTTWIKKQMQNDVTLKNVLSNIIETAKTSVMACFYSIQNILPGNNLLFVKKHGEDFWRDFNNPDEIFIYPVWDRELLLSFLDIVATDVEKFKISQYDVCYYKLIQPPHSDMLKSYNDKDIKSKLLSLSNHNIMRMVFYMDSILYNLDIKYVGLFYYQNRLMKKYNCTDSLLQVISTELDFRYLLEIVDKLSIDIELIEEVHEFKFVIIKEKLLNLPECEVTDPNSLLRKIVEEVYPNESIKKLQQINGVVSNINSTNKAKNQEYLYSLIKYRFVTDFKYIKFYSHRKFDLYVKNKVERMVAMRKS